MAAKDALEELRRLQQLEQQLETDTRPACPFFAKVGACRYGPTCSRAHLLPPESTTILLPNMHSDPLLLPKQRTLNLEDEELSEEVDEKQLQQNFIEFFEDTHDEFLGVGEVVQFKVCRNQTPHLRGNVYVQYKTPAQAAAAVQKFNNRFFGGMRLAAYLVTVPSWKSAICGTRGCPKGEMCNFLHVFRNPGGLYKDADNDFGEGDDGRRDRRGGGDRYGDRFGDRGGGGGGRGGGGRRDERDSERDGGRGERDRGGDRGERDGDRRDRYRDERRDYPPPRDRGYVPRDREVRGGDRGMDRGVDRGMDRGSERGMDRGPDRDYGARRGGSDRYIGSERGRDAMYRPPERYGGVEGREASGRQRSRSPLPPPHASSRSVDDSSIPQGGGAPNDEIDLYGEHIRGAADDRRARYERPHGYDTSSSR
ncbi:U2 small nuclear ribonucleoprotein auxiliary factor 35 kDa subunit- protein 2 [Rhizoclosmatium sp. JEL0117]|nr:U2 small nuclear ribonucleoprotein auxiliary factor 35 kDa subunit- protein 2 [Rhizoclosmatium sp. JEL0117]